jgi:hypothetical protein
LGAQASNPGPGEIDFTLNFPSYTSGHAMFGAAVFRTLERFYGTDDSFTVISDECNGITRGLVARMFGRRRPIPGAEELSLESPLFREVLPPPRQFHQEG